ncbi:ASTRA complex subunit [Serendipita sp. 396]|nr:ASTRA complex subunit [Serendipita sp. 396]KAG8786884.1 ASTRA complex subunit [Serendipita sp. 397]
MWLWFKFGKLDLMSSPNPLHIIRSHQAQINCVAFSEDNERLYSADIEGWVTLTSTRTLRPLARWRAHTESTLAVQEWNESIVTHGRDHKLHVWSRTVQPIVVAESVNVERIVSAPPLLYSLDVNALNFCKFDLFAKVGENTAVLAVPNLIDSNYIDLWDLPARDRLHAAVGKQYLQESGADASNDPRLKLGAAMTVHVFEAVPPDQGAPRLNLLVGYEDGSVILYRREQDNRLKTVEGQGWTLLWRVREHVESVMAMALAPGHNFALSVSADAKVVKYDLSKESSSTAPSVVYATKLPGNGALSIRSDSRVCAIGSWNGKVQLYSTKSFKSLGTLTYHKDGCYALAFAQVIRPEDVQGDDDMDPDEIVSRGWWLGSGGKDTRICIWPLKSFERGET